MGFKMKKSDLIDLIEELDVNEGIDIRIKNEMSLGVRCLEIMGLNSIVIGDYNSLNILVEPEAEAVADKIISTLKCMYPPKSLKDCKIVGMEIF